MGVGVEAPGDDVLDRRIGKPSVDHVAELPGECLCDANGEVASRIRVTVDGLVATAGESIDPRH